MHKKIKNIRPTLVPLVMLGLYIKGTIIIMIIVYTELLTDSLFGQGKCLIFVACTLMNV